MVFSPLRSACAISIATLLLFACGTKSPPSTTVSTATSPPSLTPANPAAPFQTQPAAIIQKAVLTRALGIEDPRELASMLDTMPPGLIAHDPSSAAQRSMLWSAFFKGSLTKLGNIDSRTPLIVFYNPIMDVAVFQTCEYPTGSAAPTCQRLCAAPGELLEGAPPAKSPIWLAQPDALDALKANTAHRMAAFERDHPSAAKNAQSLDKGLCSSKSQSIAELRLLQTTTALTQLNAKRLTEAVARYVRAAAKTAQTTRPQTGKPANKRTPDPILELLAHLDTLSLSAAIPSADKGWLLFLTPRHTGWKLAVVRIDGAPNGQLTIRGARLLKFTSTPDAA